MKDFLFVAQPLLLLAILFLWVYCIVDALKNHRPWLWVAALVFVPVVSAPFYLVNYKFFSARGGGRLDRMIGDTKKLRALKEELAVRDVPSLHRQIAAIHIERGEHREALLPLKRALDMDPEDLRTQFQAGVAFLAVGNPAAAIPHLQYVLEVDPRYAFGEARLALANALLEQKKDSDAFDEFSRVVDDYNLPEAVVKHARMLKARGMGDQARQELRDMLKSVASLPKDRALLHKRWIKQAADDLRNMG